MAFYNDKENQDEDLIAQPNQSSGESASLSPGAPGAQANAVKSKQGNPGNFVGITNYLNANKNQASELGNQVGDVVSSSIDEANSKIGEAGNKFGQYANQSAIAGLDNATNDATNIVNKAANTGKLDEADTTRFNQVANASYKGPKTLQDAQDIYNPAYESYNKAKNLSDLTKNEEGAQELTKKVANPGLQYTPGENRLDSYLLNTQENKQKLADARANAANLDPSLQAAQKQASDYATNLANKTSTANKTARDLLSSTAMAKKAAVDKSLANQQVAVENNNKLQSELAGLFGNGGNLALTPQQMQLLGLSEGQKLYGATNKAASEYFDPIQPFDANKAISKDNQAQLAALANLASGYGGDFKNPYAMADLAGTASYPKDLTNNKVKAEAERLAQVYNDSYNNKPGDFAGAAKDWTPKQFEESIQGLKDQLNKLGGSNYKYAGNYTKEIAKRQAELDNWKNKMHLNDIVTKK
jgi:hypothetical protein